MKTLVAAFFLACSSGALAIPMALPEQLVCGARLYLVARISDAHFQACPPQPVVCRPPAAAWADVEVERVIARAATASPAIEQQDISAGTKLTMLLYPFGSGANRFPPTLNRKELPNEGADEWLRSQVVGSNLVLMSDGLKRTTREGVSTLTATTLPLAAVPWLEEVLSQQCTPPNGVR